MGLKPIIRELERRAFLEDGEPRQAGLVDLEHHALEESGIVAQREAVFGVVIGAVERVAGGDGAVGGHESLVVSR